MNKKLKTSSEELHPIPVKAQMWAEVGVDLIGPLTETPRGNKYIITLTDYFYIVLKHAGIISQFQ